ncbi:O-antigen ligase family protein [Pseudogemmobacter sp. W21_MBD1_M6]|uniref:O-antigen ligase family protein n=1 Tax=Pseudogemmobacter sp. W21_MBD1_M6 TaxID=3240271 RepID=UPI003F94669B
MTANAHSRVAVVGRVHDVIAVVLIAIVLIAPIPMGSNRPIVWMVFAPVLGMVLTGYVVAMLWLAPSRPMQIARHYNVLLPALLIPVAALFQTLAVAWFLPPDWVRLPLPAGLFPETISLVPTASLLGALRQFSYVALFVLVIEVAGNASRVRWMSWWLFAGLTAHGFWALLSLTVLGEGFFWGPKTAYLGSATGTFINRNSFATFMGMGLVLGVCTTFDHGWSAREKRGGDVRLLRAETVGILVQWLCLLAMLLALLATQSRMGIAASLFAALGCVVALRGKRPAMWRAGIAVLVVLTLMATRTWTSVLGRSIFIMKDSETRLDLYRQVVAMIRERPLSGYGLDAFAPAFELFHQRSLPGDVIWDYAHSSYLTLWVEMGILFGSLPVIVLVCVAVRLRRAVQRSETGKGQIVAAMGVIALTALHSMVDFSLEIEANVFLFLTLIALGLSRLPAQQPTGVPGHPKNHVV